MNAVKKASMLGLVGLLALLVPSVASAQQYIQTNLVSNLPGATTLDTQLVNSWGLTRAAGGPWWVADNGANPGVATVYNGAGAKQLTVNIPTASGGSQPSAPTGVVANGTTDFPVNGAPAKFIFVTEQGVIAAWNGGSAAITIKDNSPSGAIYKGCTIAESNGKHYLYVTNFHSGLIEVYDGSFQPVSLDKHAFTVDDNDFDRDHDRDGRGRDFDDHRRDFAPFNVQAIGTNVFVTYAKQDAKKEDEVDGPGFGFVDVFSPEGRRLARLQNGPWLNAPWGVALAPGEFGEFSHSLLVGNFGSGQIAAFDPLDGRFIGLMKNNSNATLTIDGLWALGFGAGNANSGPYNSLFFTAGPDHESNGLFGTLTSVTSEINEIDEP
jgi:uncharacterized protein (TIGR03118 family)